MWPEAIASLMAEIGADGINGDTQDGVPLVFLWRPIRQGHPLVFEPEGGPSDEALAWNRHDLGAISVPVRSPVDRFKWIEPRHMVNISDRWNRDKTSDLQFAFFNGVGWESWENIWGIWNGITPRDAEATRRVASIERAMATFSSAKIGSRWLQRCVMAFSRVGGRWANKRCGRLSTGMNMTWKAVRWKSMERQAFHYFDLYHGTEIVPQKRGENRNVLSFAIEAHGFGAILATKEQPNSRWST